MHKMFSNERRSGFSVAEVITAMFVTLVLVSIAVRSFVSVSANMRSGSRHSQMIDKSRVVPLLPLRDIIVFPHMVVPLFVGRDKSIAALEAAMRNNKDILLAAQKNAKTNVPDTFNSPVTPIAPPPDAAPRAMHVFVPTHVTVPRDIDRRQESIAKTTGTI